MTQVIYFNNTKSVISDCLNDGEEGFCGTIEDEEFTSSFCCCESDLCNHEEYTKKCGEMIKMKTSNTKFNESVKPMENQQPPTTDEQNNNNMENNGYILTFSHLTFTVVLVINMIYQI